MRCSAPTTRLKPSWMPTKKVKRHAIACEDTKTILLRPATWSAKKTIVRRNVLMWCANACNSFDDTRCARSTASKIMKLNRILSLVTKICFPQRTKWMEVWRICLTPWINHWYTKINSTWLKRSMIILKTYFTRAIGMIIIISTSLATTTHSQMMSWTYLNSNSHLEIYFNHHLGRLSPHRRMRKIRRERQLVRRWRPILNKSTIHTSNRISNNHNKINMQMTTSLCWDLRAKILVTIG